MRGGPGLAGLAILASLACAPQEAQIAEGEAGGGTKPAGLAGYEGSGSCAACHAAEHRDWSASLHARTVHEPTESEKELLSRSLLCGDHEARYVLGERHARRFMVPSQAEPGRHVLLPCRYDVATASWEHLHESDWRTLIWERSCGACHTTGFSSDDLGFAEMTVGCESCHGPASRHAGFGTAGEMTRFGALSARDEVTICASCHLQGGTSRATGLNFARNYQAGDDLFADYAFDWSSLAEGTDDIDNPIDIHQKLLVRDVVVNERGDLRCGSCHQAHAMTHDKHAGLPRQEYCHLCHARDGFAVKEYRQACNVCEF